MTYAFLLRTELSSVNFDKLLLINTDLVDAYVEIAIVTTGKASHSPEAKSKILSEDLANYQCR